jgi:biotin carboxyl carrier protein
MKTFELKVGGKDYKVDVDRYNGRQAAVKVNGQPFEVEVKQLPRAGVPGPHVAPAPSRVSAPRPATPTPEPPSLPSASVPVGGQVLAPMPGLVLDIMISVGDRVSAGLPIMKIEAMKMENIIPAPCDGVVKEIRAKTGDTVATEDVLLIVDEG